MRQKTCVAFLLLGSLLSSAEAQAPSTSPVQTTGQRTPSELMILATKAFPAQLAKEVQDEIAQDVLTNRRSQSPPTPGQSFGTLYLADLFYAKLSVGKFEHYPTVIWNGFNSESSEPSFVYEKSQFSYTTATGRKISPGTMDTDGGSIPRILHSVGAFSTWGYGPAYIIHDWLFSAHKCGVQPDAATTFEESALILAEALKTLMEVGFVNYDSQVQKFPKREDTLYLIHQGVRTGMARDIWQQTDGIKCRGNP